MLVIEDAEGTTHYYFDEDGTYDGWSKEGRLKDKAKKN